MLKFADAADGFFCSLPVLTVNSSLLFVGKGVPNRIAERTKMRNFLFIDTRILGVNSVGCLYKTNEGKLFLSYSHNKTHTLICIG